MTAAPPNDVQPTREISVAGLLGALGSVGLFIAGAVLIGLTIERFSRRNHLDFDAIYLDGAALLLIALTLIRPGGSGRIPRLSWGASCLPIGAQSGCASLWRPCSLPSECGGRSRSLAPGR